MIHIDGVTKKEFLKYVESASASGFSGNVSWQGDVIAGQKVRLVVDTNITTPSLTTGPEHTYLEIFLIK